MARRPEPSSEELASRLETVAEARGVGLTRLAREIGVTPSTITRGCAKKRWSKALVSRIEKALDRLEGVAAGVPAAGEVPEVSREGAPRWRKRDIDELLELLQYLQQGLLVLRRELDRSDASA